MSVKHCPAFLILFAVLSALSLSGVAVAQHTAEDFFQSGEAKRATNDWDGAIADFTKAIELNPKDASAYDDRGVVKVKEGDLDGAIADFTKAIELDPTFLPAYANRGYARKKKGDQAGADADYAQAEKLKGLQ